MAIRVPSVVASLSLAVLIGAGCTAVVDAGSYSVASCDPIALTGCEPGLMCFANVTTGARVCIDQGTRPPGSPCTASSECSPGSDCVLHGLPDRGICLDYCTNDAGCGRHPDSIGCNVYATGLGFCWQGCDPAVPSTCGAGVACFAMGAASACVSTGPRGLLEQCGETFEDACAPGFACLPNVEGVNICFPQCGPGLPACSPDTTCTFALGDTIRPAEAGEWGVCAL